MKSNKYKRNHDTGLLDGGTELTKIKGMQNAGTNVLSPWNKKFCSPGSCMCKMIKGIIQGYEENIKRVIFRWLQINKKMNI